MPRIFVSQRRVHQWTEEGRVSVEGNVMNLPELGRTFKLTEAFFVERVVSESGDAFKLTGRVKTRSQIASLGGEVFLNSLIIGDAAYEGDPGFVGEIIAPSRAVVPVAADITAPVRTGKREGTSQPGATSSATGLPGMARMNASSRDKASILGVGPGQGIPPEGSRKHS